ncbi:hypothetical protein H0A36_05160 [Endozoicomonas sp. SM1973]|uniref:DUF6471 domain-containing protein n=1 Tax=Spartinivicinus marinus TaxID=2994442 RepID=A0A853HUE7_9GAMM|nr:DUF6471 domain-containing protein [Spartinivicinus marinus]MCX4029026.1 DUF6471 domain-containing protein [Spartinivicinus marinus]NYZ65390.1 hypothetical protein [Spartinivicinus marinus]
MKDSRINKSSWDKVCATLVQQARQKNNLTFRDLAELIKQKTSIDIEPNNLANRVNRGNFSASLLLAAFFAMEEPLPRSNELENIVVKVFEQS